VSRGTWEPNQERPSSFAYRIITFFDWTFQSHSTRKRFFDFLDPLHRIPAEPHNPDAATRAGFNTTSVWAVPRSLAATRGIAIAFSSRSY
jgi:hypothetical protein